MREQIETAKQAIVDAASNPKVALVTGVAIPGASSVASKLELITSWAGAVSGVLAMCTAAVVLLIQLLKLRRDWRKERNAK